MHGILSVNYKLAIKTMCVDPLHCTCRDC